MRLLVVLQRRITQLCSEALDSVFLKVKVSKKGVARKQHKKATSNFTPKITFGEVTEITDSRIDSDPDQERCQLAKPRNLKQGPLTQVGAGHPMESFAMDLTGPFDPLTKPGNKYILSPNGWKLYRYLVRKC